MIKFDYIFVDLDGPILDGKLRHYHCYRDIINKDGGQPIDIDTYWSMKRNKIKRNILLEKSLYKGTYDDFYTQWLSNIEKEYYLSFDVLKPYVRESIIEWKKYSKEIVLVTMRQSRNSLLEQLNKLEIFDLFDDILSCSIYGNDIKYNAIKHLEFQTAVFIGDTEEDMNTAKMLNIPFIGIISGLREKEYLVADVFASEIKDINMLDVMNLMK